MIYLIMECHELSDQWECDAERSPITLTEDWKKWYENNCPSYPFEVYKFENCKFSLIKGYGVAIEKGMVFAYYKNHNAIPIKKFPNATRNDPIPNYILAKARQHEEYDEEYEGEYENCLSTCGHISWWEDDVLYCYTEYYDSHICFPY